MFVDEKTINEARRARYVERIERAIERIGVIDGCDAMDLARDLVGSFDFALRHHLAEWSRVELRPQTGLGTPAWVRVRGRVAEKSTVQMPHPDEEPFDVLVSCWYRFLISGMPATPIRGRRGEHEVLTATDDEGFFDMTLSAQPELGAFQGYLVELEVGEGATVRAEKVVCDVQVPSDEASVGVLVDLDGVLFEHPPSRFTQVLAEIVLGPGPRRIAGLPGLAALTGRLAQGNGVLNPMFFLSNAPRHLYSHVELAVEYAGMPRAYIQLRDFDLRLRELTSENAEVIEMLLAHEIIDHYESLPFLFVGTTRRAARYASAVKAMGHRVQAVYLLGDPDDPHDELDELDVRVTAGDGTRLLEDAAEHGWTHG